MLDGAFFEQNRYIQYQNCFFAFTADAVHKYFLWREYCGFAIALVVWTYFYCESQILWCML